MIIYLHGFRSGPQSWKSRSLKARMDALGIGDAFWCEQLPVPAAEAIALIEAQIARCATRPPWSAAPWAATTPHGSPNATASRRCW